MPLDERRFFEKNTHYQTNKVSRTDIFSTKISRNILFIIPSIKLLILDASIWIEAILTSDQKNVEEDFKYSTRSGILSIWLFQYSLFGSLKLAMAAVGF